MKMKNCAFALAFFLAATGVFARVRVAYPLTRRGRISSGFGWRVSPVTGGPEYHTGVDISVPAGTGVRAVADGRILYAGWLSGYGWTIKIAHINGVVSTYAHLSAILCGRGTYVYAGQRIGLSGNSGLSTGPHLHFAISRNAEYVNPLPLLKFTSRKFTSRVRAGYVRTTGHVKSRKRYIKPDVQEQIVKNLCKTIEIYSGILMQEIPEIVWEEVE